MLGISSLGSIKAEFEGQTTHAGAGAWNVLECVSTL